MRLFQQRDCLGRPVSGGGQGVGRDADEAAAAAVAEMPDALLLDEAAAGDVDTPNSEVSQVNFCNFLIFIFLYLYLYLKGTNP